MKSFQILMPLYHRQGDIQSNLLTRPNLYRNTVHPIYLLGHNPRTPHLQSHWQ